MLWNEISAINDMFSKLLEIAERDHRIDYDTETGEIIAELRSAKLVADYA